MHKIDPVDELADLRAEIARLEARAAKLRAAILQDDGLAAGRWHRAVISENRKLVFDADLLPQALRDNPLYWRERVTRVVKCVPVAAVPQPRPGWPIRRDMAAGLH